MLIGVRIVRIQLTGLPLLPLVLFGPGWSVDDDLPTRPLKLDIRILRGQIGFKADDAIGRGIDDVVPPFWGHRPGSNGKREGSLVTKIVGDRRSTQVKPQIWALCVFTTMQYSQYSK